MDWVFLQPARVSLGSATQRRSMITKQLFIVDGGGRNLGVKAQTWKSIRARHVPCELTQVFDIIQGAHGGEFQKKLPYSWASSATHRTSPSTELASVQL